LTGYIDIEDNDNMTSLYGLETFKVRETKIFGDFPIVIVNDLA
jgi:hypothetical protein